MFPVVSAKEQHNFLSAISLFLGAMLIFCMLFSSFFIAVEHDHHCLDENCPICEMVAICESIIDNVGSGLFIYAVTLFTALCICSICLFTVCNLKAPTLVSQKIRLNN